MKLDKHVVDMFTELTKPADDVKMEKTCYGTISVVDGTRYVKLDGSDLLVPAASTVKTSHGDRVTVLMKNHSLTVTGNLTAPATDGEGSSSGEAGTAATIEVGTVTTGEAGSLAAVTNSGTTSAAVFDFVIPRGDKGEKGDPGPQGPQGEKGDTGTWDGTIPNHEHTVSDITDFPTSLPANGGNADTVDGKHASDFASSDDKYWLHTLSSGGDKHGAAHRLYAKHNVKNDGRFYIQDEDSHHVRVNYADGADTAKNADASKRVESPNGKAILWEDNEGGNLKLISPDGNHGMEMDLYNNTGFRMYFIDNGTLSFPVTYNFSTKKFNINGNADTLDGLHAADLFQKSEGLRSENMYYDIFSTTLSSSHTCWNKWCYVTGNASDPSSSDYIANSPQTLDAVWYEVFTGGGSAQENPLIFTRAFQIAIGCYTHQRKAFIRYMHDNTWSGWFDVADGGNADTLDGFHANEIASNPNLLINPDFRINQRGISSPTAAFGVDRWIGTYTVSDNTIVFSQTEQYMVQLIENIDSLIGREATATVYYDDGTADKGTAAISDTTYFFTTSRTHCLVYAENGIKGLEIWAAAPCNIVGVKLELGSIATPFVPPDPATELAKCQRYAIQLINGVQATVYRLLTNFISFYYPLPTTLRNTVTSTAEFAIRTDNNVEQSGFTFAFYPKPNGIIIEATKSAHGITLADNPILVVKEVGIFDAEL